METIKETENHSEVLISLSSLQKQIIAKELDKKIELVRKRKGLITDYERVKTGIIYALLDVKKRLIGVTK